MNLLKIVSGARYKEQKEYTISNIHRVSKFFKWVFQLTFIALPILLIIFWIKMPSSVSTIAANHGVTISYIPEGLKILHPLSTSTKILGFVISLIPLSVNLFILYFLIYLFKSFEKCEFFSRQSVSCIKYIGYVLFIGQLVSPIYQALLSAALTWHNPPGERMVSISFSGTNLGILLTALLMILVSWIMTEGHKIKEDQRYTI